MAILQRQWLFFILVNFLFGAAKLNKNADLNKYSYLGYGILYNVRGTLSISGEFGKNAIMFHADLSSSLYINNKSIFFHSW